MRRQLTILIILLTISSIYAITSITHPAQKSHCLRICHEQVTACINLRHDKCLKSYHTCLSKAKDFYRCTNSSKIKQMKQLTICMRDRCDEVPEYNFTLELMKNPYRTMHRKLHICRPWAPYGKNIRFGKVLGSEEQYQQCKKYVCQIIVMPFANNNQNKISANKQRKDNEKELGYSVESQITSYQLQSACFGENYGIEGRSSIAILNGACSSIE